MIGILSFGSVGEDLTRFRDSRGCTRLDLRHTRGRASAKTIPPSRRHRSLKHPSAVSFPQRVVSGRRHSFLEWWRSLAPVQKIKIDRIYAEALEGCVHRLLAIFHVTRYADKLS